jgi:energy-coupling factor transport system permease protein
VSGRSAPWRAERIAGAAVEVAVEGISPEDADYLRKLGPETPSPYHRLNPLTKAVAASVETLAAFVGGGYVIPLAVLLIGVIPSAVAAGLVGRLLRVAGALSLPIGISVALVSVFTRAGETVLFQLGPFDATLEGVDFAAQIILRLFVLATALALFGLTTEPRAFVVDLERRGLPPRLAFAAAATLEAIPLMIERALAIQSAQRARGLDTEGSVRARIRGVMPLVGPVILSSLTEVEERSLALEVRAFGRPGRRHLLWWLADSPRQRVVRWALLGGLVLLILGRASGALSIVP